MSLALYSAPENLCLLRLSAIDDVTHVLPTLRTIQHHWPECRITWIIGRTEASLVGDIPGVECIIFDTSRGWKAYRDLAGAFGDAASTCCSTCRYRSGPVWPASWSGILFSLVSIRSPDRA